jgi:hypothetical protein
LPSQQFFQDEIRNTRRNGRAEDHWKWSGKLCGRRTRAHHGLIPIIIDVIIIQKLHALLGAPEKHEISHLHGIVPSQNPNLSVCSIGRVIEYLVFMAESQKQGIKSLRKTFERTVEDKAGSCEIQCRVYLSWSRDRFINNASLYFGQGPV